MNNYNNSSSTFFASYRNLCLRRAALAAVIGVCAVAGLGTAHAQETTGSIFGRAPVGQTVVALSTSSGLERPAVVDAQGRYLIDQLPGETYTVMLEEGGRPVLEHLNVPVTVGDGIEVDLSCAKDACNKVASRP